MIGAISIGLAEEPDTRVVPDMASDPLLIARDDKEGSWVVVISLSLVHQHQLDIVNVTCKSRLTGTMGQRILP